MEPMTIFQGQGFGAGRVKHLFAELSQLKDEARRLAPAFLGHLGADDLAKLVDEATDFAIELSGEEAAVSFSALGAEANQRTRIRIPLAFIEDPDGYLRKHSERSALVAAEAA